MNESWQLIDGQRSADGLTYTAVYWCTNTGSIKTETTSDGRYRAGEGPRIRKPALLQKLADVERAMDEAICVAEIAYDFLLAAGYDMESVPINRIAAFLAANGGRDD